MKFTAKKVKSISSSDAGFSKKEPILEMPRPLKTLTVAAVLAVGSFAMAVSPGYVKRVFTANHIPTYALTYSYYDNLNQLGVKSAASIIRFFKDAYCNISMDTTGTAKEVGMRFLKWAAKQKGVDLSWFDPGFLERLAVKVGEELKGGATKIVLADLVNGQ